MNTFMNNAKWRFGKPSDSTARTQTYEYYSVVPANTGHQNCDSGNLDLDAFMVDISPAHLLFMFPPAVQDVLSAKKDAAAIEVLRSGKIWDLPLKLSSTLLSSSWTLYGPLTPFHQALAIGSITSAVELSKLKGALDLQAIAEFFMKQPWTAPDHNILAAHIEEVEKENPKRLLPTGIDDTDFLMHCAKTPLPANLKPATDPARNPRLRILIQRFLKAFVKYYRDPRDKLKRICIKALCGGRFLLFKWICEWDNLQNKVAWTEADFVEIQIALCAQGFDDLSKCELMSGRTAFTTDATKIWFDVGCRLVNSAIPIKSIGTKILDRYGDILQTYLPDLVASSSTEADSIGKISIGQLLHFAIRHKDMVRLLIEKYKANPTAVATLSDGTKIRPLELAIMVDADDTAKLLMERGWDTKLTEGYIRERFIRLKKDWVSAVSLKLASEKHQLDHERRFDDVKEALSQISRTVEFYVSVLSTKKMLHSVGTVVPELPFLICLGDLRLSGRIWRDFFESKDLQGKAAFDINTYYKDVADCSGSVLHAAVMNVNRWIAKKVLSLGALLDAKDDMLRSPLHIIAYKMAESVASAVNKMQQECDTVTRESTNSNATTTSWIAPNNMMAVLKTLLRLQPLCRDSLDANLLSPLSILTIADCVWFCRNVFPIQTSSMPSPTPSEHASQMRLPVLSLLDVNDCRQFAESQYSKLVRRLPIGVVEAHPKGGSILHGLALLVGSRSKSIMLGLTPRHAIPLFRAFVKLIYSSDGDEDSAGHDGKWVSELEVPMGDGRTVIHILEDRLTAAKEEWKAFETCDIKYDDRDDFSVWMKELEELVGGLEVALGWATSRSQTINMDKVASPQLLGVPSPEMCLRSPNTLITMSPYNPPSTECTAGNRHDAEDSKWCCGVLSFL
jgi:hypothetical protein